MWRKAEQLIAFLRTKEGSLAQRVARSTAFVGVAAVFVNSLALVKSVVLARLLTPEAFGIAGLCTMVIRAAQIFTETGIGPALIQRRGDIDPYLPTAYTLSLLRGVALMLIVMAIAPFASHFFESDLLLGCLLVMSIGLVGTNSTNIEWVRHHRDLNFWRIAALNKTRALVDFVVAVTLALWLRSVWALVWGFVVSAFATGALSFLILGGKPRLGFNKAYAREMLGYGRYITGLAIVLYFMTEIDNAVVAKLLGTEQLGYYALAFTLANYVATHVGRVIASVMFPAFSELQADRARLIATYQMTLSAVVRLAAPISICLAVLGPDLVPIIYGEKWTPMVVPLQILALYGFVRAVAGVGGYVFNALGQPRVTFYLALCTVIVIAIIIVPMTLKFGTAGAALAMTIPAALQVPVAISLIARRLGIPLREAFGTIATGVLTSIPALLVFLLAHYLDWTEAPLQLVLVLATAAATWGLCNLRFLRERLAAVRTKAS